jgi:RNA polymerase sigma factor (sigma-70 family)
VFSAPDLTLTSVKTSTRAATTGPASEATHPAHRSAFAGTRWSVVLAAGSGNTPQAHDALAALCQTYWHPLYAYVRRAGYSREEAEDLTQEFFTRLLAQNTLAKANPARGRFRSFLLASLKHFLAHEWEKARARKRGGGVPLLPLEFESAETRCLQPLAPGDTPDRAFDRQWALALLDVVLERLRQDYSRAGRDDLFLELKETLSGGRAEIPYRDLALRLGLSEGAVKVAAHRLRRRYRDLLREEIANTVSGPDAVEEELRQLFAALSG